MTPKTKHITLRADIPQGVPIGDLSREFPDITFNITNGHWIKKDERILYITSNEWTDEHYNFLKKHKSIKSIEKIGNVVMIHVKSEVLSNLEQKNLTIIHPTYLKNGKHKIEFLINHKQLNTLKNTLPNCEVLQINDSYKPKVELTQRQEEILNKAQSLGYYKYPREVSLTELAKLLKISKSTLSQTLRAIEYKGIQSLLNGRRR